MSSTIEAHIRHLAKFPVLDYFQEEQFAVLNTWYPVRPSEDCCFILRQAGFICYRHQLGFGNLVFVDLTCPSKPIAGKLTSLDDTDSWRRLHDLYKRSSQLNNFIHQAKRY